MRAERALHDLDFKEKAASVRKISLYYNENDGMLFGIQLFDEQNNQVMRTNYKFEDKKRVEYTLEKGERIIGFTASSYSQSHAAYYDF